MRSAAFSNPHSEACRQPAAADRRRSPLSLFVCLALWLTACRFSAASESDCASAEGLAPVIGPGRVVLLGEIHGTRQAPLFAGTVVCQALNKELGVTLALELPHAEEVAVRGFVRTAAQAGEPPRIIDLPFWAKPYQDGRSSDAMLSLLERVRAWRLAGEDVDVILLDDPSDFAQRDRFMARRIVESVAQSDERFLVALTGNLHNRTAPGSKRMGEIVVAALGRERVKSLNMTHAGGSAWICEATAGCGPFEFGARETGPAGRVSLLTRDDDRGYDGTWSAGEINASPPASTRGHE